MKKQNFESAQGQNVPTATEEQAATLAQENKTAIAAKEKSLEEQKLKFDRLSALFFRKSRFESANNKLSEFLHDMAEDREENLESKTFKLSLSPNSYGRDSIDISNKEVIKDAISYLKGRIALTIEQIEQAILEHE